jgi:predicted  nucleic acid-binding Zn-ribbon protein
MRHSRQSSPKVNSGSRPISPRGDLPRSGAATPVANTASSALASKLPTVDGVVEDSAASSKTNLPDEMAVKDPRLRRLNTKVKPNSGTATATPMVASPQPVSSALNKLGPAKDQSKDTNAGFLESASNSSNARSISPSIPQKPFTGPAEVIRMQSAHPDPIMRNPAIEAADVTMTDVHQASLTSASAAQDPLVVAKPPQGTAPPSNLMESFVKLMTDFADQVATTSILKYKKEIAKQKTSRCKYNDRRNRENFKDYPVTLEQGTQARQLAEQELASVDQKLKDHVKTQDELARTMAGFFLSHIEQQKGAREFSPDKENMLEKGLDKIEQLSTTITSTLAEVEQAKLNTAKSVKEAYELVERATATCEETQQAAQKTFAQVNEVSARVNELSRNANTLHKDVLEDQAQIRKVMSVVKGLEDDTKSLRKRTADAEDDVKHLEDGLKSVRKRTADAEDEVKGLWDLKAQSTVLEQMRKDVNGDIAQFKNRQKELLGQVKTLEANLKKCLQSYDTLAPEVEKHSKKIDELNLAPETPHMNDRERMYDIEITESVAKGDEQSETPAQGRQSDIEELRRSFRDLSEKFGSSASQSEFVTLRGSITSLQIAIEKLNAADISKELEAFRKDAEADREELRELTKEVDELHTGQDQIRETFTTHNDSITERVDKAEKDIHDISEELKVTCDKAKEEAQSIAKQINGVSKRVEATITASNTARPTPPSAPPTPQMHQTAHVPGRGSSPVIDNGVLTVKLNEVAHDLMLLRGYINGQFSASSNLPATLNSLNQAILSLQSRYNNLTTEPVVRAMVQQMQMMYPYASTAHKDIRDVRAAVIELEKLPPTIGVLSTVVDSNKEDIAKLEQKVNEQDKERVSSDNKQERLVAHVKEERDNLKQHVQEQHEKLKQHVEKQYEKMDRSITAIKEELALSVAQVAAKVDQLERVAGAWTMAKRAEGLSQLSDKDATPKPAAQNRSTASYLSPKHHRPSSQTQTSSPGESDREALLKKFDASTHSRRAAAKSSVSDPYDSDAPLLLTRTTSSESNTVASPNGHVPGTSGKRKRAHDTSNTHDEQQPLSEIPSSPSKRKVIRRS